MLKNSSVRIAIVGCGLMTRSVHLPAALRSPKINLAALVDSRTEYAEDLAKMFALKCRISDDLSEIIDSVDGVLIVTPNHTHYPIAKVALEKGIPVLIEKPITTKYSDALELCEIAEKNNTFISVGYRTRYFPSVIMFKRLLERGYFRRINHFHYEFGSRGGWAPVSGYNLDRKKSGGGVLVVSGTHFLDRMLYWFGDPKEINYKDDSYGGVEANCKAELVFENDSGRFTGSFFMSKTVRLANKFTLDSEKYKCEIGESESEKIIAFPKHNPDMRIELFPNTISHNDKPVDSFKMQLEEFADNILQKSTITVDGWFAARSIRLIEEMYGNRSQLDEPWLAYRKEGGTEMFKPRIAIFGASGFVGSTLVERLYFDKGYDFKALIHSFGNAARLARLPIELTPVDVLDYQQVERALSGCNVVVNCSRGGNTIMLKGLRNIIKASRKNKIDKFIHLGSIAIYGSNPPSGSYIESMPPAPGLNAYGLMKLKQDEMVFKLNASGIPSVILCPSNISGPYSVFVLNALQSFHSGQIALVDDGKYPTNLIHVDNLVQAILAAIDSDKGWGERYFINETEQTTWREFFEELKQMSGLDIDLQSVTRDAVLQNMDNADKKAGLAGSLRQLMSRDVRHALSAFSAFKKFDEFACNMFFNLKPDTQAKLRYQLTGPTVIRKETNSPNLDNPFIRVQVRTVFHSPEKIMANLNYKPLLNYEQRKKSTESWLKFINIHNQVA